MVISGEESSVPGMLNSYDDFLTSWIVVHKDPAEDIMELNQSSKSDVVVAVFVSSILNNLGHVMWHVYHTQHVNIIGM